MHITTKRVFKIITWGGLGDSLLVTPSFRAIKTQYPDAKIIVYCKTKGHKEIYKNNPYIYSIRLLRGFHYWLHFLKLSKFYFVNYGSYGPAKFYRKGASEIISEMLGIDLIDKGLQVFITGKEYEKAKKLIAQYAQPVGINPTSRVTKNQEWVMERWEEVVRGLPQYTFLQLGLPDEEVIKGAVDLRGKLSLRETMAVFAFLKGFVGAESLFGHLANATGIPAVILFGPSNPMIWGHPGNKNIYKSLSCSPCIDLLLGTPCPYGKKCMKSISSDEVKQAILEHIA